MSTDSRCDVESVRLLVSRCVTAGALGLAERVARRSGRRRPARTTPFARVAAASIACLAPAGAVGVTAWRSRGTWRPPSTGVDRVLVTTHLLTGVLIEELLWRAPLLYLRNRPVLVGGAGVSTAVFVAIHVRRDGARTVFIHLPLAVGLTVATLIEGRVRPAVLAHLLYNVVAVCLAAPVDPAGTADPAEVGDPG